MSNVSDDSHAPSELTPRRSMSRRSWWAPFGCGIVLVVLCLGLLPAIQAARDAAWRSECTNNLKQIAIALHNYHDIYRAFPAAYMPDGAGKPMCSWRVATLPYIMSCKWIDQYDFKAAWDSPNNLSLLQMQSVSIGSLLCPSATRSNPNKFTPYVMIVGDDAASRANEWTRLADLDDPANTILIAEIANSDVFWGEPRDLEFDKMSFQINDPNQPSISSHHPGGALTIFADGSVHFLSNDTDPAVVRALCTRDARDNP
jgi:hypothetical protein